MYRARQLKFALIAAQIVSLAGLTIPLQRAAAADGLIVDAATGCATSNPFPRENERIRWNGACKDGLLQGRGTLIWFVDGLETERNTGFFQGGEMDGAAVTEFSNGGRIHGTYVAGVRDGIFYLERPDGAVVQAQYRNGEFENEKVLDPREIQRWRQSLAERNGETSISAVSNNNANPVNRLSPAPQQATTEQTAALQPSVPEAQAILPDPERTQLALPDNNAGARTPDVELAVAPPVNLVPPTPTLRPEPLSQPETTPRFVPTIDNNLALIPLPVVPPALETLQPGPATPVEISPPVPNTRPTRTVLTPAPAQKPQLVRIIEPRARQQADRIRRPVETKTRPRIQTGAVLIQTPGQFGERLQLQRPAASN